MAKLDMKDKKQVYVFRTLPFTADSRVKRYLSLFPESSEVVFKTWEKENISVDNVKPYPFLKGGYVVKKILNALGYQLFSLYQFIKLNNGDVAVFMDLDAAYLSIMFKWLNPGVTAIFDIVDPISQTKGLRFSLLHKIIDRLEFKIAVKSDLCIVPHSCRIEYYYNRLNIGKSHKLNSFVLENVPDKFSITQEATKNEDKLSIGYFGTLDPHTRGLEELIKFGIEKCNINVILAGDGGLKEIVQEAAAANANIYYLGLYNYKDLQDMYNKVDFTWAYYCPKVSLHEYACPNKYFEHIMFTTPIITNKIIPQAQAVIANNSGIVLNIIDDIFNDDFTSGLDSFKSNSLHIQDKLKASRFKYSSYYQNKAIEFSEKLAKL